MTVAEVPLSTLAVDPDSHSAWVVIMKTATGRETVKPKKPVGSVFIWGPG